MGPVLHSPSKNCHCANCGRISEGTRDGHILCEGAGFARVLLECDGCEMQALRGTMKLSAATIDARLWTVCH